MTEKISSIFNKVKSTETYNRLNSETSDYFKPIKKAGGWLAVSGIGLKLIFVVINVVCPATIPATLIALTGDMIWVGLSVYGTATLTKKK